MENAQVAEKANSKKSNRKKERKEFLLYAQRHPVFCWEF
jgi:hypothetical protein